MEELSLAGFAAAFTQGTTWFVVFVTLVSGIVRGFSGFGGALIFIPVVSAVLGPRIAVPTFYLADLGSATPYGLASVRKCNWGMVLPMLIGTWIAQPFGATLLETMNPDLLRWGMAGMVIAMLALLLTGWRFRGEPKTWLTFLVGVFAGGLGGATGISGPPVIAYWLGGRTDAVTTRANIMVYYAFSSLAIDVIYFLKGMFTLQIVFYALIVWPCYAAGLAIGARLFGKASDDMFRRVAYALVAVSAVISLPLFDGLVR
jgi:uncharacterized membrane protein YfcA